MERSGLRIVAKCSLQIRIVCEILFGIETGCRPALMVGIGVIVLRAGLGIGSERVDQVGVRRNIFQRVECVARPSLKP